MDVNFEDLLSKFNFSEPISGEDLLKYILGQVDPIIFSNNIKDNMINPLLGKIKGLYDTIGKSTDDIKNNKASIEKLSEPLGVLDIYKDNFKNRISIGLISGKVVDKLLGLYGTVGKELDSNIKDRSKAMADPLGVLEVRKEYKNKVRGILSKSLDGLNTKNVEEVVDNTYQDSVKKDKPSKNQEQKSLNEKNVVDLSDDTLSALSKIAMSLSSSILSGLEKGLKGLKIGGGREEAPKESGGGWLATILGALAMGGLAVGIITTFWGSHIRPWLEEKIGFKFTFLDKLSGIFEGLGKWLVLGTVGAGGMALKLGGLIFQTAGEIGEKLIGGVFKSILGEGAEKGLGAGAVKVLSGATFKKIFGKALGGVGKAALRGIPIIGSLISIGFGVDNLLKGNYVQGGLDFLNGLVGLIPGVGIPLSLGVSALQIFLEAKTLNLEGSEKNSAQAGMLGSGISSIFKGLWSVMRKTPILEGLINLGEGFWKLCTGDFKGGLNQLINVPLLGAIIAPISAILDNVEYGEDGKMSGFNLSGFYKDFKVKMLRAALSMVPTAFGMRYALADMMGIGDEYKNDEWKIENSETTKAMDQQVEFARKGNQSSNAETTAYNNIERLNKQIEDAKTKLEEAEKKWRNPIQFGLDMAGLHQTDEKDVAKNNLTYLENDLENQKKILEIQKFKKIKKVDDLFVPSKSVYDPQTNTEYQLAPDDNVLAYKSDGVFDKTLNEIKNVVVSMGKKISELNSSLSNQSPAINSVSVNNSSSGGGGNVVMSGKRDPIFDVRADYWRKFPNERAFI